MSMGNNQYVTTQYNGRMGNNLFQIAAAISYGREHSKSITLPMWGYKDVFSIPDMYFEHYDKIKNNYSTSLYTEKGFHYNIIPKFGKSLIELQGYFQSYKYFDKYKDDIIKYFTPKAEYQTKMDDYYWQICRTTSDIMVSVHVRLGDYINFPNHHPIMPSKYYEKAIKYLKEEFPKHNLRFVWFSDSIISLKRIINQTELKNLVDYRTSFHYIDGNKDYEDMYFMQKCDCNIIGNSTFSWWGAYLNNFEHKVVVSPHKSQWFGAALSCHDTSSLLPPTWKEILF